jgi:hypothetical protein
MFTLCFLVLAELPAPAAGTGVLLFRAVEFHHTIFAEWGVMNDEPYEDRYSGMVFDVFQGDSLLGRVSVCRHWFDEGEALFPGIGDTLRVEGFDFRTIALPCSGYSVWYDDFLEHVLPAEP